MGSTMTDKLLRAQLAAFLDWKEAHVQFDDAVKPFGINGMTWTHVLVLHEHLLSHRPARIYGKLIDPLPGRPQYGRGQNRFGSSST